jgi:CarboxypepD_reg-like domain
MKQLLTLIFVLFIFSVFSQNISKTEKVSGTIINEATLLPIPSVTIINVNKVKGTVSSSLGFFEIEGIVNDTLHISSVGYQSVKVKITSDWPKNKSTKIKLTLRAFALDEVVIRPYNLTGYLEIDSKLIPIRENNRYSISGLPQGYEAGAYSPGAFGRVLGSIFNPADMLYNFFGKKPKELKRLREMKKDDAVRNLLETRFDRETISALLGVDKKEIAEILARCSYSEDFVKTANDLQIMDAMSECYEEYKILKKK